LLIPWTIPQAMWARIHTGRKMTSSNVRKRPEDYDELESLMKEKKLKPLIESVFPMKKSADAFNKAEFGNPRGKIIITV